MENINEKAIKEFKEWMKKLEVTELYFYFGMIQGEIITRELIKIG